MACRDPFRRHRFPSDVILLVVRWYCRYPLAQSDVRNIPISNSQKSAT